MTAFHTNAPTETERRSMTRQSCFIPVDYTVRDRVYRDFIHNLSEDGAFIRTNEPLDVGTKILMTFSGLNSQTPIKSHATIVRQDEWGVGVKFDSPVLVR
jgi:Tfp pilus assembly protein PilZ